MFEGRETEAGIIEGPSKSITGEECGTVWRGLLDRTLEIADVRVEGTTTSLLIRRNLGDRKPFRQRHLQIVERVLLGTARKVIAAEFGVSPSTVCTVLKRVFGSMGLRATPGEAMPLVLTLFDTARGARGAHLISVLRRQADLGDEVVVVRCELDLCAVLKRLPDAERAVLRLRAAGHSYADIAARRNTSYRTVANQIAMGSKRLGVSGHLELVRALVRST